ncbi:MULTISPECIES: Xaa-Pro peptidase family protein [unclassified Granulicatella]|uniref:M24 family metallopeptidase n=1 Tax=unclassified Granulicatella TaxID=2630493 RepID=UPI001074991A|nr:MULTISPECIES: Xaa-Pro peptidase family protein [unclassified Granulicatella]MBF0781123.1 aminopeptidase P family protein [Granulicatella sp. 19428wC4_WM01]TFU91937.1 aminopeptidase P family protein [Granulicatella sp. WM01]
MSILHTLQRKLQQDNIDLCFVQNPSTIGYLTGFHSEPHERLMLLVMRMDSNPLLILPALDYEKALAQVKGIELVSYLDSQSPWETLAHTLSHYQSKSIRCSIEKDYVTMTTLERLQHALPFVSFSHNVSTLIQNMRLIKTPHEIELMLGAGKTADLAIKFAAQALDINRNESDILAHIEYQLKKHHVPKMSFDTMVLSQANAANPHGEPGNTPIQFNEFVLVDLGTLYQGYASDMTRTLFFGDTLSKEQEKLYNIVLEAHHAARDAVKIGMTAGELDQIARDIISQYGYGDYFTHRLGHGIGQSVHEFPSIASGNDFILQENMCFSIEPGIYLPNKIGIRIEDCFYVTPQGAKPFTHSPYSLNYRDYQ